MNFKDMGLSDNLIKALNAQNIISPTQIQEESYKTIEEGRNVIGCSETGSGKTLAYLLPLFSKIDTKDTHIQALIIVPTQELGIQVYKQILKLSELSGIDIKAAQVIGEGNINRQIDSLKAKPHVVVGTTGRILKLLRLKKMSVHSVKTLVIDEADKMLSKDNIEGLLEVRRSLMKYTQILMFSASINKKSIESAKRLNIDPIVITIENKSAIPQTIKHMFVVTKRRERIETLRKVIHALEPDKAVIFANTAYDLEEAVNKLKFHHYSIDYLYGSDNKLQRKNAIDGFRNGNIRFLVSTDLASRGLQIDGIDAVFNINLPESPVEYQHRAGRCGRNNRQGICISIITENEISKILNYQKEFGINIVKRRLFKGKLVKA